MKLLSITFFLILYSFANVYPNKPVIIKGKIKGKIPEKIFYTLPENGMCFWGFTETFQPSSFGTFTIRLNLKSPGFVKLYVAGKQYIVIAVPGNKYELFCDLNAKENNIRLISPDLQELHQYYNKLPNPVHIHNSVYEFSADSVPEKIMEHVKQTKNRQINFFADLLKKNKISNAVFELLKNDRNCYYASVQGTIALLKRYSSFEEGADFPEDYYALWKDAFNNFDVGRLNFKQSPWYYNYLENYLFFKEYTAKDFSVEKLIEIYNQGQIHTHSIEIAKKYLNDEELDFYIPAYIYIATIQKKFEKELISLYKQFKKKHPKNPYIKYSEQGIDEIVRYYFDNEENLNNIRIINNYERINSLQEALKLFRGSKVFIDVWASWCGSCLDEFKNYQRVIEFLNKQNIKILYISTDNKNDEKKWRKFIKFYKLTGYHIRANKMFVQDLRNIYNQNNILSLPWHIFIDENGNIVKKELLSPDNFEEFKKYFVQ